MLYPSLHINKVFREKFEKFLRDTFNLNTMENIRYVMKNKDTCVIALIMFYESKGKKPIKLYRVLSCVLYFIIDNYFCIDCLCYQYQVKYYNLFV